MYYCLGLGFLMALMLTFMRVRAGSMTMKPLLLTSLMLVLLMASSLQSPMMSIAEAERPNRLTPSNDQIYGINLSEDIYNAVSEQSYIDFIIELTENGSRWVNEGPPIVYSDANIRARDWISQQLVQLSDGRITVELMGEHNSVVGRLPGWLERSAPCLMIGGHYDSVPGAPGANDDGTGVAATLELARILSEYEFPLDIYFCAWNSEENGLIGSGEVAQIFADEGIEILMYYNVDMLLVQNPAVPVDERVLMVYNSESSTTYHNGRYWAELAKMMSNNLGLNLIKPLSSSHFPFWMQSDHYSFIREGYDRAMFAFESGWAIDDAYHQPTDTWDNPMYNYTLAKDTVGTIGASMAFTMANAYGEPTEIYYNCTLEPGATRSYYFVLSIETDIGVEWFGSDIAASLFAPNGSLMETGVTIEDDLFIAHAAQNGLCTLVMENTGGQSAFCEFTVGYNTDIDGDGAVDSEGYWFDQIQWDLDNDGDGLSNAQEMLIGTDRWNADSDGDGMRDGWEYDNGLDPLVDDSSEDPDLDGLANIFEYGNGTLPHNNDTDADLLPDGWETDHGLNPLVDDANLDPDGDFRTNLQEYQMGSDPDISNLDLVTPIALFGTTTVLVVLGGVLLKKRRSS
ncbi:MAG: M20/M25/M40 family metallo-hydrolase [Candidatus Thorarchaeota archaeon]